MEWQTRASVHGIVGKVGRFVITGSSGTLGQRVQLMWLEAVTGSQPAGVSGASGAFPVGITAIDQSPLDASSPLASRLHETEVAGRIDFVVADVQHADLAILFSGADAVVHLASESGTSARPISGKTATANVALTKTVLDAASRANVGHVVILSSAVVYGAWPDNPVPLTEDAPIRPNVGFAFADDRVEIERLAEEWKAAAAGRILTVLRPAASISSAGSSGWLATAVWPAQVDRVFSTLPPVQFVHVDDVASAVLHSVTTRLDGVFNVAPDRWLRGEDAPPLMGTSVSIPATGRVWELVSTVAATIVRPLLAVSSRPYGALPWSRHPWVVANDRLRATGWAPLSTTEEVLVSRKAPSKFAVLFARKRQEVTIAALGSVGLGVAGALFSVLRRRSRP
jgi:nucleoside-diphosphate-sugar epimerase